MEIRLEKGGDLSEMIQRFDRKIRMDDAVVPPVISSRR
jgi:hypothetical protein